jgi:hypothetical protein
MTRVVTTVAVIEGMVGWGVWNDGMGMGKCGDGGYIILYLYLYLYDMREREKRSDFHLTVSERGCLAHVLE